MGKGFENYMSKKWFHPTNVENQKRKYLAEQKSASEKKRQQDLREQYEREQEIFSSKQLMGDEKARLGLAFMYNAPGMLKDQQDKNKQEEKIDWQKNAPRESSAKNNDSTEVKKVRCLKCKRWGHVNTDRSCPLYGKSRLDTDDSTIPQLDEDELNQGLKSEGLAMAKPDAKVESESSESEEEKLEKKKRKKHDSDDDDDDDADEVSLNMLRSLSKKERKVLLKRLKKIARRMESKLSKSKK